MSGSHFNTSSLCNSKKSGQNINEVQDMNSLNFTKVQVEFCYETKLKHYVIDREILLTN